MVAKAESQHASGTDKLKLIIAAVLVVAALVGFYVYQESSLLMRVLGLLVVAALAAFLVYQTDLGKRTVHFFRDARTEVRKVVWPTREDTTRTTLTVLAIVILVGILLYLLDSLLGFLFRLITGIG